MLARITSYALFDGATLDSIKVLPLGVFYVIMYTVKMPKIAHDGLGIGFMTGILLILLLPVLSATGVLDGAYSLVGHNTTSKNSFSGNPPYTPPQSTRESIPSGEYAGWTQYHHTELGFAVNIPAGISVAELPQTKAEAPRYPEFVLQFYYLQDGIEMESARITVYDSAFATNTKAQEQAAAAPFTTTPTIETGKLLGRDSVQYFYEGDTRTVVYLINDGDRTFEVRGLLDSTDPSAVATYWDTFNKLLKSFSIDS